MSEKKPTFEKALSDLESIVQSLERDDLPLGDSVAQFEKVIGLLRQCETHLKNTEGKLKELLQGADGTLVAHLLGQTADALQQGTHNDR